jgi:two-component system, cell cycle sensor histidine kinase and response regulator CckA
MNALTQLRSDSPGSPALAVLLAAFQTLPESLAIVEDGLVLYANPAWAQTFEYADWWQLRGRVVEEFIPGDLLHRMTEPAPDGRSETCPDGEYAHPRHDGTQRHLQVSCGAFRIRGREYQVIGTRDISGQKQIESRLRQSERLEAIGRLVAGVAHDFNNLLTGLMLYCDLLIGELEENSRSRHHAQEMRNAGEQGARLVEQLLAVVHPPGEGSYGFVLNDVVTGVEELLTHLVGENIVLRTLLAADLGAVRMDPARVQQILLNLVLNARDAMPDGGQITVTTRNCTEYLPSGPDCKRQLSPCVELTVADNGCGMDAETLSRAFQPFFTTKKPGRGNGLGLATASSLAGQHGGSVVAESEPGRGTRVALLLPRVNQDTETELIADSTIADSTIADSKLRR